MNPDCLKQIRAEITPDDFSNKKHKAIFKSFLDVTDRGDPILPTSIVDDLKRKKRSSENGVSSYLGDILTNVHTSAGWRYHIKQIKTHKLTQALLGISSDIADGVKTTDARDLLSTVKERIAEIRPGDVGGDVVELSNALPDVIAGLEKNEDPGITTGLYGLDDLIGGWQGGDLIILAGRPGMGKSVLAKDFSEASKVPVLFFSLEMPKDQLIKRQLSSHSNINFTSIRRSRISQGEWPKIIQAADKLNKIPIAYNDKANMNIDTLVATCEARRRKEGIGMVVIDYLQLIKAEGKPEHREREVASISSKLKGLARSLNIPVICLAQLNRSCEARGGDKKPMLSDLRESGSIEQDADTVIFIWREAVYKKSAPKHDGLLIVAKGRNTGTGVVSVYFDGSRQIFRNLAYEGEGE
jgi:replicative DNA helicase